MRQDADRIIRASIRAVLPDEAVKNALRDMRFGEGRLILIAIGKAAWQMAEAAVSVVGDRISDGIVITKYGHSKGDIKGLRIMEAGHPVPDKNSYAATEIAVSMVSDLKAEDTVLFLISGGGSALFEMPLIADDQLKTVTQALLASSADIVEINTIRKRLSAVKGGRFAEICSPARVVSVVLSDIIGDPLDMIASGPAYPDSTTSEQALSIVKKYNLALSDDIMALLSRETPKGLRNVETHVVGNVRLLCDAAARECEKLGYTPVILTDSLACNARDAGSFLASIGKYHADTRTSLAFIAGGETVVRLTGDGLGGRNQEIALSAAIGIQGLENTAVFSLGSDGTDGPTDAAGGYCDGSTFSLMKAQGIDAVEFLMNNDSYHALQKVDCLIKTGPTGTNVNDISVLLIRR